MKQRKYKRLLALAMSVWLGLGITAAPVGVQAWEGDCKDNETGGEW